MMLRNYVRSLLAVVAFCLALPTPARTQVDTLVTRAPAAMPTPFLAHVHFAFVHDATNEPAPDPCAGRAWSLAHPLRLCGRVRIVPADPIARNLWYGEQLAALIDAAVSAAGQRALFEPRTLEWSGVLRGTDISPHCYCSAHFEQPWTLRGRTLQLDHLGSFGASPSAEETDMFAKPFASTFAMYLLGGVIGDAAQSFLENGTPGLRPLDTISQRDLLAQEIYAHTQGIASWWTVQRDSAEMTAWFDHCAMAVQRELRRDAAVEGEDFALIDTAAGYDKPRQCAYLWPSLSYGKGTYTDVEPIPSPEPTP